MSEESILILNMLREGKISAEQADSLLRAVRETGPATAPPPTPAPPPAWAVPDPAAMASMQARLAELQGKLGELQGKLGAAQTARAAGQAASLAGKVLDHLPRPDLDMGKISKSVDEAMRGLNSLKNDAVRTARTAARQASQEARRAAREGRKAMKFEFNLDFGAGTTEDRPGNGAGQPQADETSQTHVTWDGADRLVLENKHGGIKIVGSESTAAEAQATVTKTAWAETEAEARVLLQQVFLTHQVENGRCKIGVAAPQDARERLTVDYEISVPRGLPLEVVTSFGAVAVQDASPALTARSASGNISVSRPWNGVGGDTRVVTASGDIQVTEWSIPTGTLTVEATSGDLRAEKVSGDTVSLSTRSGDLRARDVQAVGALSLDTASGDLSVENGAAGRRAEARTQSGHLTVSGLRAEQVGIETVSGDADVKGVSGAVTVKTVSGDVEASGVDSPAVSLVTVSGDARWAFPAPFSGSFAGTTVSGDIALALPPGSDTRLEMNTTSGGLTISVPVTDSVTSDRHAAGTLGGGVGSVRLQSVSGDLKVE